MLDFLKKVFMFRVGQKATRAMARTVGLGSLAGVIGLIGGYRHMKKHA